MLAIDPARHHTNATAQGLFQAGIITREDYALKANMSSLVNRFEREHGPLTVYADGAPWASRIERIETILYSYVPPAVAAPTTPNPNDPPRPDPATPPVVA